MLLIALVASRQLLAQTLPGDYIIPGPGEAPYPNPHYNTVDSRSSNCDLPASEATCDFDAEPIHYIAVNFHYILTEDGQGNFTETGDGLGGTLTGYQRAEAIVNEANHQLDPNYIVWNSAIGSIPPPVCKINFRLVLKGVYFIRDNYNLASDDPVRYNPAGWSGRASNYKKNSASEINTFWMNVNNANSGLANGEFCFVYNDWINYAQNEIDLTPDYYYKGLDAKVLLHEIFHNNGLWKHPFQVDDCIDTPTLPNCWNDQYPAPCNVPQSNNLMDYNAYLDEWALSPCQICRLNTLFNGSYFIQDNGCPPSSSFFTMPSTVCGPAAAVWMDGSASFNEAKHFIEIYEVPAVGSETVVGSYKSEWFDGPIGRVNLRSYMDYAFQCNKTYRVKLATSADCGDWNQSVRFVQTQCPLNCPGDVLGGPTETGGIDYLKVSPNPTTGNVQVEYKLSTEQKVTISVYGFYSIQTLATLKQNELTSVGTHSVSWSAANLANGNYVARIVGDNGVINTYFTVQH